MIPSAESIESSSELVTSDGRSVTWKGEAGDRGTVSFQGLTRNQQILLQDLLHRQEGSPVSTEVYPDSFGSDLARLVEQGLVVPVSKSEILVPREVAFHPAGPGSRPDQLPAAIRFLPEEILEGWQESHDVPTGLEGYLPLGGELLDNHPPDPEFRSAVGNRRWLEPDAFPEGADVSVEDLYAGDPSSAEGLKRWVLKGWLFPVLESKKKLDYWVVASHVRSDEDPEFPRSWIREKEPRPSSWTQVAFSWWEQLQMGLILSDALPFRVTRRAFPNRLDLGEVKRLTGWDEPHVQNLTNVMLERNLIKPEKERFFLTERAETDQARRLPLWIRPDLWREELAESTEPHVLEDYAFARHGGDLLRRLLERDDEPSVDADLLSELGWKVLWDLWAAQPVGRRPHPKHAPQLLRGMVEVLMNFGWLDGGFSGDRLVSVRSNDRTEQAFQEVGGNEQGDLPIILQPDGDLMVPLQASLEWFRRINPFALLVEVDHMIRFHVDRESLVQASNEGWDCGAFRDFLEEHTGELPDPVASLFKDLDRQAEEVEISEVHHLIEFEDEGTASRARRALSNYEPRKVNGTLLLLGKKTTRDTIRRNLSRAGIQIEGTQATDRASSPLVSVEE